MWVIDRSFYLGCLIEFEPRPPCAFSMLVFTLCTITCALHSTSLDSTPQCTGCEHQAMVPLASLSCTLACCFEAHSMQEVSLTSTELLTLAFLGTSTRASPALSMSAFTLSPTAVLPSLNRMTCSKGCAAKGPSLLPRPCCCCCCCRSLRSMRAVNRLP